MPVGSSHDPREALVRTKYFTLRPQPLEHWLWRQRISPSAERVFWLHWQEGMRSRDWCSCIPIRRVAALCSLDVSSVTRAYQALARLGLIRRQDPGRDPERPFEQAVAVTEVRVPRALLDEWQQHPDRCAASALRAAVPVPPQPEPEAQQQAETHPQDPFEGMNGRARHGALSALLAQLSASERRQYDEAIRRRQPHICFDETSKIDPQGRGVLIRVLQIAAAGQQERPTPSAPDPLPVSAAPRQLTVFEVARLRRDLQQISDRQRGPALLREIVWAVERGALRRFSTLHAVRIALKKVREGLWTRPHRMPPNWCRELGEVRPADLSPLELCRSA